MGFVAEHLERIASGFDQLGKILVGPLPDQMRPLLYIPSPQRAHLRIVEQALRIAQGQRQRLDWRPHQLVYRRLQLFFLHRRLVHVDQRVPTVVVEKNAWFGHRRLLAIAQRSQPFAKFVCAAVLFPAVCDNAMGIIKGVNPQAAPFLVVGQFAGQIAAGARDKVGVAGAAGVFASGLVAQVEGPTALV